MGSAKNPAPGNPESLPSPSPGGVEGWRGERMGGCSLRMAGYRIPAAKLSPPNGSPLCRSGGGRRREGLPPLFPSPGYVPPSWGTSPHPPSTSHGRPMGVAAGDPTTIGGGGSPPSAATITRTGSGVPSGPGEPPPPASRRGGLSTPRGRGWADGRRSHPPPPPPSRVRVGEGAAMPPDPLPPPRRRVRGGGWGWMLVPSARLSRRRSVTPPFVPFLS